MGDNNKDLEDLARSTTEDYYELLGVPFDAEESAIKRAYRKASIRYHPDKNPDSKDAADKFINLGLARDILIDAKLKGEYDRARTRRREKAFQDELLTGNRRKMKEELERRERESANFGPSLKRKRAEDMSEAEKREQEIQRLAEDGRRRRKEMQERREKARKEDEAAAAATAEPVKSQEPQAPKSGQSADIDRTIKVRFHRDSKTAAWDRDTIRSLFTKYGNIDSVIITGKDKKLKLEGQKLRKLVATVFIVYKRLDHAHAAVSDAKEDFPALESIAWVNGEPDLTSSTAAHANGIAPKTASLEEITMMRLKEAGKKQMEEQTRKHAAAEEAVKAAGAPTSTFATPANPSTPSTPVPKSFRASLNSSLGTTPLSVPKFSFSPMTPSSGEVTKMRLKNAEKKQLEEQIRKREAAEEAAEAAV